MKIAFGGKGLVAGLDCVIRRLSGFIRVRGSGFGLFKFTFILTICPN